jgi:hypothetical protein
MAETMYSKRVREQRERIVNCVKQDRKCVYLHQFLNIPRLGRTNITFARKIIAQLRNAMDHHVGTVAILDDLEARADKAAERLHARELKRELAKESKKAKAEREARQALAESKPTSIPIAVPTVQPQFSLADLEEAVNEKP